jgi:hypothetical protein
MITPTRQVIIPATNRAPPPMNAGRSLAQANTFPERIVSRHEPAAAAVRTGPMTTIIMPRMKISDLNHSHRQGNNLLSDETSGRLGGFLSLCYYPLPVRDMPERELPGATLSSGLGERSILPKRARLDLSLRLWLLVLLEVSGLPD